MEEVEKEVGGGEKGNIEDRGKDIVWVGEINCVEDIVDCLGLIELEIVGYSCVKGDIDKGGVVLGGLGRSLVGMECW